MPYVLPTPRAACCALLGAQIYRMLIGAFKPMACPIHFFNPTLTLTLTLTLTFTLPLPHIHLTHIITHSPLAHSLPRSLAPSLPSSLPRTLAPSLVPSRTHVLPPPSLPHALPSGMCTACSAPASPIHSLSSPPLSLPPSHCRSAPPARLKLTQGWTLSRLCWSTTAGSTRRCWAGRRRTRPGCSRA